MVCGFEEWKSSSETLLSSLHSILCVRYHAKCGQCRTLQKPVNQMLRQNRNRGESDTALSITLDILK